MNRFVFIILFAVVAISSSQKIFSLVYYPGSCGTQCMANRNYYGTPYGNNPVYYYPQLPFHTMYGPTPYYFRPYAPSPYQPTDCVACMLQYQRYTQPIPWFPGGMSITSTHGHSN